MSEPLLALDNVRAGYGPAVVLDGLVRDDRGLRPGRVLGLPLRPVGGDLRLSSAR